MSGRIFAISHGARAHFAPDCVLSRRRATRDGGLATPNRAGVCGRPHKYNNNKPTAALLAVREDGGVYTV